MRENGIISNLPCIRLPERRLKLVITTSHLALVHYLRYGFAVNVILEILALVSRVRIYSYLLTFCRTSSIKLGRFCWGETLRRFFRNKTFAFSFDQNIYYHKFFALRRLSSERKGKFYKIILLAQQFLVARLIRYRNDKGTRKKINYL